jgi:hypothetical protein
VSSADHPAHALLDAGPEPPDRVADRAFPGRKVGHDQRLRALAVQADVDGGLVHPTGAVDHAARLGAVRRLAPRFAGVNAVRDRYGRVAGRRLRSTRLRRPAPCSRAPKAVTAPTSGPTAGTDRA